MCLLDKKSVLIIIDARYKHEDCRKNSGFSIIGEEQQEMRMNTYLLL